MTTVSCVFSSFELPAGGRLSYTILGSSLLGSVQPIVLVQGMSMLKGDWERLSTPLAEHRPVLLYDHRGMGESTCPPSTIEDISIETMARDLLQLLIHLGWKDVAICGWSMGGVIVQQLLVLPFHKTDPSPLPFNVSHVFLASTRSVVLKTQHSLQKLNLSPALGNAGQAQTNPTSRSPAERRAIAKGILQTSFDPEWLQMHEKRFEAIVERWVSESRPLPVIAKQQRAVSTFDFEDLLSSIPSEIKIVVIHGELDQIIPFSAGSEISERIKHARFIGQGPEKGQVPSYVFGHHWFEYFDVQVWVDIIEKVLGK
ncbi:alpha/beta-hydrolase [Dendrothele bispora CBS 962.96]|uniref:Alpha/beta-hydrolase n=1 Tax=Dendrothele bispora (strain CBS 962.96) TaxID=1314807 RepID=A0A4S8MWT5_DENBC|nr:alpha/beta-hydrolase [Dendrothele bispora CBS 962.96]